VDGREAIDALVAGDLSGLEVLSRLLPDGFIQSSVGTTVHFGAQPDA